MRSFCIEERFQESHLKIFKARIKKNDSLSFKLLRSKNSFIWLWGGRVNVRFQIENGGGHLCSILSSTIFPKNIFLYKFLDCLHATGESNEYLPSNSCVISPLLRNLKVLFESILRLMVFFYLLFLALRLYSMWFSRITENFLHHYIL